MQRISDADHEPPSTTESHSLVIALVTDLETRQIQAGVESDLAAVDEILSARQSSSATPPSEAKDEEAGKKRIGERDGKGDLPPRV